MFCSWCCKDSDCKDLAKKTVSDKILKEIFAINPKYDCWQREIGSMVYKSFGKKTRSGEGACVNDELSKELHKPVIKKN